MVRRRKKRIRDGRHRADVKDVSAKETPTLSDPHEMALAIILVDILCRAVEGAGAVRDLVHQYITEDWRAVKIGQKLFEASMDQVPNAPQNVREAFLDAFQAAWAMPVPGVEQTPKIILEELDVSTKLIGRIGISHAVVEAFAGEFPNGAQVAIKTRGRPPYQNSAKFPHTRNTFFAQKPRQAIWHSLPDLMTLARIYQKTHSICMSGTNVEDVEGDAYEQSCSAVLSRMTDQATSHDPTYALCTAATAAMLPTMSKHDIRTYMRRSAKKDCAQIARAISDVSGLPLERAEIIPNAILEGARVYLNDTYQSNGEAAVRAVRTANMWVSMRAATVVFQNIYGLAVGAAWAATPDRDRFESIYERALETAGRMDPDIEWIFNPLVDLSDPEFDEMETAMWDFFYDASGHTLAQWAEVAREVDYRSAALLPENAPIMEAYRAHYNRSAVAATTAAANEKRSKR